MHDNQRQFNALMEQARVELHRIGKSLIDEGCVELWKLIAEIKKIQTRPPFNEYGTALGGFCSQVGRLAGVMAKMSDIGSKACEGHARSGDQSEHKAYYLGQLTHTSGRSRESGQLQQMQLNVHEFRRLSVDLQRLSDIDILYIVCDARVLHDHPELADAATLKRHFASAIDRLEALSESWWNLAEEAKKEADAYEAALAAHSSPHSIN